MYFYNFYNFYQLFKCMIYLRYNYFLNFLIYLHINDHDLYKQQLDSKYQLKQIQMLKLIQ